MRTPERSPATATRLHADDRPDPGDLRGADGHADAGGARPDDRRDRAAAHRRRPRRPDAVLVGLHRVHAHLDGHRAAVREARRRLRAQEPLPVRDRRVPARLCAVRCRAVDDAARRLPCRSGNRRGRPVPALAGRDREHRPAARPRPLAGADRCGLRRLVDHRARARRLHRRQHDLALGLLRESAGRRPGARWSSR